jgi:hypothetical protein
LAGAGQLFYAFGAFLLSIGFLFLRTGGNGSMVMKENIKYDSTVKPQFKGPTFNVHILWS